MGCSGSKSSSASCTTPRANNADEIQKLDGLVVGDNPISPVNAPEVNTPAVTADSDKEDAEEPGSEGAAFVECSEAEHPESGGENSTELAKQVANRIVDDAIRRNSDQHDD